MTVSVTPFGGGWSRRRGRRRLNPVAVTGTIIEFYTQLEINKGGKLDDRLKDTGTNRPVRLRHLRKNTPQSHQQGPSPSTPNALSTMNPRITPGVSHTSPRTPPYHTTSDYLGLTHLGKGNLAMHGVVSGRFLNRPHLRWWPSSRPRASLAGSNCTTWWSYGGGDCWWVSGSVRRASRAWMPAALMSSRTGVFRVVRMFRACCQ